jgi:2-oxo-4-hydroxy-4-carboxy--5-ureidoimidazoline (OHCU) decarboxylase
MAVALPDIEEVNHSARALTTAVRLLFETEQPLRSCLLGARPFACYSELLDSAERHLCGAPRKEQVLVLAAHPVLGEAPGRLRRRSTFSYLEQRARRSTPMRQAVAGCEELVEASAAYERRFGFRLVVFVNGRSRARLVPEVRRRLQGDPDAELAAGIRAVVDIARSRVGSVPGPSAEAR